MKRLLLACATLIVLTGCSTLSQAEMDELAQLPTRIESIYKQGDAILAQANSIWEEFSEGGSVSPEMLAEIRALYGDARSLYREGEALTGRVDELRAKAAEGEFDWDALWYLLTGLVSAASTMGVVRFQRGPPEKQKKLAAAQQRRV